MKKFVSKNFNQILASIIIIIGGIIMIPSCRSTKNGCPERIEIIENK